MRREAMILLGMTAAIFIMAGIVLNRQLRRDAVLAARIHAVQRTVGIELVVAPAATHRNCGCSGWSRMWGCITRAGARRGTRVQWS